MESARVPDLVAVERIATSKHGVLTPGVLLYVGVSCPDQCPTHMANIGAALKKLPAGVADQVKLVFVTTDPARDTPVELRRWLDNFDRHFVGLTGTEAALEAVQKAAGVPPAHKTEPRNGNYSSSHADFVFSMADFCGWQYRCVIVT